MCLLLFIALSVTAVSAQSACPDLVTEAMAAVEEFCLDLGRNQACYGNIQLNAEAQPNVEDFVFDANGDIVDLADILTLELNPMDIDNGIWGVAVMSLQADIPDSLPGQNVTFILFGDVYLENASSEEQNPMQAFYLRTGIGDSSCEEAPESGLLIQTPEGVDEVSFNVNGVDVSVGSTVLFQTEQNSDDEIDMIMSTVEGTGIALFDDESYPAIEGTRLRVPLNNELLPTGRPDLPESYEEDRVRALPIAPLPRHIELAPPLAPDSLTNLHGQFQNGLPPCDAPGLPACENLPPTLRNGVPPPIDRWGEKFVPGVNCIPRTDNYDVTADPPPVDNEQPLPVCPPTDRNNRPDHVDPLALNPNGDHDHDSIPNSEDACPYQAGREEFHGCPNMPGDRDEDGIPDRLDQCPDETGREEFHGCPEPPVQRDSDGDDIADSIDFCPNRPGIEDYHGCPEPRGEFKDSDEDGISDALDECPYHTGIAEFDGCPDDVQTRDGDGDGVPDAEDRCPSRRGKLEFHGCPDEVRDSDGDGIADSSDLCPNRPGVEAFRGCPEDIQNIDRDGDGTPDIEDKCPNHVGLPELSGCPKENDDTVPDSDGDGIADDSDRCPNVRGLARFSGCPDSDSDGIPNPLDACPDQGASQWGLGGNGCPLSPPDSDGDGVADDSDRCPNVRGLAQFSGCPDSDGDGIPNPLDACPDQGASQWGLGGNGCPLPPPDSDGDGIRDPHDACPNDGDKGYGVDSSGCPNPPPPPPDSDGDGVADDSDRCPNRAGLAQFSGCPDSDSDGIPDPLDACPQEAGPVGNKGCP
jgi:hypothetical protein